MKKIVTIGSKLKQFEVTMELCCVSFSGHDYLDKKVTLQVAARNSKLAIKKAEKAVLDPGKGKEWSQYRWVKHSYAKEINCA
jgi:hypothetical protein